MTELKESQTEKIEKIQQLELEKENLNKPINQVIRETDDLQQKVKQLEQKKIKNLEELKSVLPIDNKVENKQEIQKQNNFNNLKQIYSRKSLNTYLNEYKHNENIQKAAIDLQKKFDSYRSVRGDGNCYFRAVGFSYLEHLLRYTTPVQHLQDFINKIESDKGYYQIRPNNINNSHQILKQTFLRLLNNLKDLKEQNQKFLQQQLAQELEYNKDKQDEALVWQMRCLTANYLESHKENYEPFCQTPYEELIRNVLTMGKEADGLGVGPLQVVLKVKIDIVTIDRNYAEAIQLEQMKIAGKCPLIFILYKPGHYDIIYSKDQSNVDGFDEQSEQYQERIRLPVNYDVLYPNKPFFVEIEANGQESLSEEFKDFKIQYVVPYKSTEEQSKKQNQIQDINQRQNNYLQQCAVCQQDIEAQSVLELECHHKICKFCLKDWIETKTGEKKVQNIIEKGNKIGCCLCKHILTIEEIKKVVEKGRNEENYNYESQ